MLERVRGTDDVDQEFSDIKSAVDSAKTRNVKSFALLTERRYRGVLVQAHVVQKHAWHASVTKSNEHVVICMTLNASCIRSCAAQPHLDMVASLDCAL